MTLRELCLAHAPALTLAPFEGDQVDAARLLWALAGVESTYGRDRLFARLEPAYQPRGVMYVRSEMVRCLWRTYGALAACSFGAWQMMASTALELGQTGHPCRLQEDEIAAPLVARYLVKERPATLADCFDAYNSGSCRDRIVPEAYVRAGLAAYRAGWDRGPQ